MKKRETDYALNQIVEIVDTTFHDYPVGTKVKIVNKDLYQYHVVNITNLSTDKRWWWVKENQIKPLT
jgi:hypothetical protein